MNEKRLDSNENKVLLLKTQGKKIIGLILHFQSTKKF